MNENKEGVYVPTTLEHRKSADFITEYSNRASMLVTNSTDGDAVSIFFGRDTPEIINERIVQLENGTYQAIPGDIATYRLVLANITMPREVATALAKNILHTFEQHDKNLMK